MPASEVMGQSPISAITRHLPSPYDRKRLRLSLIPCIRTRTRLLPDVTYWHSARSFDCNTYSVEYVWL
jgi:hypothetical protein